ncbi:type I phosphomannose isomerase catalytic subunit [Deinococcus aquaticus]|uniref:type I phosphomannose isomerase catalytic subunit n=1 Tax=Deinococcus aquaticus TaxID=328692 RepID=UPI00360A2DC3
MTHPTSADLPAFVPLTPRFQARVWGGDRLAPPAPDGTPIGEAWIADGQSVVSGGPLAGQTVADLMGAHPAALLGAGQDAKDGFPLLIKLLDCRDWLSVQVHPNDAQAREMVGPGERGKTEAWHFLHVEPGAELLAGVQPGTTPQALADAIRGAASWTSASATGRTRATHCSFRRAPCTPWGRACCCTRCSRRATPRTACSTGTAPPAPDAPCTSRKAWP